VPQNCIGHEALLHSGYHPEGDGQTEKTNHTLEQYFQVYCNYQQDNWSKLLPLAEFTYNNTLSATTGITPFLPTRVIIQTSPFIWSATLHLAHACDFITDLDSYTNNSGNTLLKLNINTKLLMIPGNFWLWNSQMEAKYTSRLNYSI